MHPRHNFPLISFSKIFPSKTLRFFIISTLLVLLVLLKNENYDDKYSHMEFGNSFFLFRFLRCSFSLNFYLSITIFFFIFFPNPKMHIHYPPQMSIYIRRRQTREEGDEEKGKLLGNFTKWIFKKLKLMGAYFGSLLVKELICILENNVSVSPFQNNGIPFRSQLSTSAHLMTKSTGICRF